MGNIVTYLEEFGDKPLSLLPFNEVDNLVLAELSYVDLTGIVPTLEQHGSVGMAEAMRTAILLSKHGTGIGEDHQDYLAALGESARFGKARLFNLSVLLDAATDTQFCALHIALDDHTTYVSFRGTDNSIVGWREDFNMSYEVMPSEELAADYLNRTIRLTQRYRVGGHSKGGTLAVYAALRCQPMRRKRIMVVYSNDGPGLSGDIVDLSGYAEIEPLIRFYVPAYSVFGQLFRNKEPDKVVRSSGEEIMQHDGFTWEVEGDSFVEAEGLDPACVPINDTLRRWIESTPDLDKRREFIDQSFRAFQDNGITQQTQLTSAGPAQMETILLQVMGSTDGAREVIGNLVGAGATTVHGLDARDLLHERHLVRGAVLFCIGLYFVVGTDFAADTFGYVVGLVAIVWLGKRLLDTALSPTLDDFNKRVRIVVDLVVLVLASWAMANQPLVERFSNVILGLIFLAASVAFAQQAMERDLTRPHRVARGLVAVACFVLGIFPILTAKWVIVRYLYVAGAIMTLYGAGSIVYGLWLANHPGSGGAGGDSDGAR